MAIVRGLLVESYQSFYEEVGRRIRDARLRRKPSLTQHDLAEQISLTRTSITNIEKGRQKILLHTLTEIADALKIDPAALLPTRKMAPERDLDHALKDRPKSEKDWIKSAVFAARKGGADGS